MTHQRFPALLGGLLLVLILMAGCDGTLDANVATLNAAATQVASGNLAQTLVPAMTPSPTEVPNLYDLTSDPTELLVHAWGLVYALPSGSPFTVIATERQVADYIIQTIQLEGFDQIVLAGNATLAAGQIRLDVGLKDTTGAFGQGTVTFQPTLDAAGRVRLNPQGSQFGSLQIPDDLLPAFGDAVHKALTGARNDSQSHVNLSVLSLENGVLQVSGTVR
jgi:hypothetical protein